jgi:multiple antibiotic resistance protein
MLNPFALFIYLTPIMKDLSDSDFLNVLWKASLISLGIFLVFLFAGDFIINDLLQIDISSLKIFGGIIIFSFAYIFIVKGEKAFITMKATLDDLASEIALPFMVGAGTISLTLLMREKISLFQSIIALFLVLGINFIIIISLKGLKENIKKKKFRIAFDKNMDILLRINGFFIGAIGIHLIKDGILSLI